MPCLTSVLHVSLAKIVPFLYLGPKRSFSRCRCSCDPAIPSSTLLAPPVSSPCLDTNEGTDLQVLDHRVIGHCNCVRKRKYGKGNRRSY